MKNRQRPSKSHSRSNIGAIGVDGDLRVHALRGAAQRYISRNDGLLVVNGHLTVTHPDEAQALRLFVDQAVRQRQPPPARALQITRTNGQMSYQMVVLANEADGTRCATILISDPVGDTPRVNRLLQSAYGLTEAEASIADSIVRGLDVHQIAEQRGCSVATVRALLKRVFAKTGVRRQLDLVRLVLSGALAAGAELEGHSRERNSD